MSVSRNLRGAVNLQGVSSGIPVFGHGNEIRVERIFRDFSSEVIGTLRPVHLFFSVRRQHEILCHSVTLND